MTTTVNPIEINSIIEASGLVLAGLGKHTPGLVHRNDYQDDKFRMFQSSFGTLQISVFLEGDWVQVFSCDQQGFPKVFRHGAWVNYLYGPLVSRAKESIDIKEDQESTRLDQEMPERFEPIDDAAVFGSLV